MSNRKYFKMYARYDGNGRLIPGSNIWAKKTPALGNWVEVQREECCDGGTYGPVYVCGAGTADANGKYTYNGLINGKPSYIKGLYRITWGEYPGYLDWEIAIGTDWLYYSSTDSLTPDLAAVWIDDDGDEPAPIIQLTVCSTPPPCTTYQVIVSRGLVLCTYLDCDSQYQQEECGPGITTICAIQGQISVLGQAGIIEVGEGCLTTTTTTIEPTTTTTTTIED